MGLSGGVIGRFPVAIPRLARRSCSGRWQPLRELAKDFLGVFEKFVVVEVGLAGWAKAGLEVGPMLWVDPAGPVAQFSPEFEGDVVVACFVEECDEVVEGDPQYEVVSGSHCSGDCFGDADDIDVSFPS